ncbi:MAG: acyl-CoA dehydrogenase family protein [Pseudomonadales bacterium]
MADPQPLPELSPFLAEIAATGPEIERARRVPEDLARRMAAAGLFRMLVPETYGGGEVHPQVFFDTLAATARADGAVGWVLMIGATTGVMAASLPDDWSRTLYGDHPDNITSGVTAPIGRAVPVEGGMRVSGRWPFGSGSQVSQWICGGCLVMDGETPRQGPHGPQSLLMFFPREAVTIHEDTWFTSGLCGTGSHDIEVTDVFVPEGRWVELGRRARVDAPLYRFPTLGLLAIGVSAVAVGIAERAIEAFIELATKKTPTGSRRSLAERSSAQKDLARAEALVGSARALTRDAIGNAWEAATGTGRLEMRHKAGLRLAASNNAWSAAEAVDLLYHAAGGTAIYQTSPLQRCFRDVHVATQHIMVAQPTYEVLGKISLGIDPKQLL